MTLDNLHASWCKIGLLELIWRGLEEGILCNYLYNIASPVTSSIFVNNLKMIPVLREVRFQFAGVWTWRSKLALLAMSSAPVNGWDRVSY